MAVLSVLYPYLLLDCPGVPYPLMDDALRRAGRAFCKETHAVVDFFTVPTVAAQADYTPTMATDTEFLALESVKRSTTEFLAVKSREYLDAQQVSSGVPQIYAVLQQDPLTVRVHPTPDSVISLVMKLAHMPTQTAATLDSRLTDRFREGVVAYAKYWLMIQPGHPWSNPEAASFSYRQFDSKAADARVRNNQEHANLVRSVHMSPLA